MKKMILAVMALFIVGGTSAQAGSMSLWANSVHESGSTMHADGSMGIWAN